MSSTESSSGEKKGFDLISRGDRSPSPLGTTVFVGLRTLDPFVQYGILAHGYGSGLLHRLGLEVLPQGVASQTGTFLDALGLSPYRLVLLSMAVGSSVKQIFTLLVTTQDGFPASSAVAVSAYNTLINSINDLLFTCAATSASVAGGAQFPQTPLLVGSALYTVGLLTEVTAEVQRWRFKKDPANKGKVYDGGLWSLARHINYGGYTLWRAGFTIASAGWTLGTLYGGFLAYDFTSRAIPVLDQYCGERYGEQWVDFKRNVPYKLFPFIY